MIQYRKKMTRLNRLDLCASRKKWSSLFFYFIYPIKKVKILHEPFFLKINTVSELVPLFFRIKIISCYYNSNIIYAHFCYIIKRAYYVENCQLVTCVLCNNERQRGNSVWLSWNSQTGIWADGWWNWGRVFRTFFRFLSGKVLPWNQQAHHREWKAHSFRYESMQLVC